jgi:hypothetical protein
MKSELDRMVQLTTDLLVDVAYVVDYDATRDAVEIQRRCASEGSSFLTKTLPALGKVFDRALARTYDRSLTQPNLYMSYPGFKVRGGYPEFLGDLFRYVFDCSGRSLSDADPYVVRHIRQILYLWYKYELPYTQSQKDDLEDRFLLTEASLPSKVPSCPVLQGARDLIARVCSRFSREAISPRHGPGSVATKERQWEKWRFSRIYLPIEREFPFSEWYTPSASFWCESRDPYWNLEILTEGTARAVFVPKDSRGPRLISCEPLEYQWIQQGIAGELVYCINSSEFTSGRVNFTHQEVNRMYALYGSMGAGWCTLDMADASDRVSTVLVERLFANTHVLDYLLASRTQCTVLPSGRKVRMKKFAPMGSALCFPVESLVFFALAVNVLVHHLGYSLEMALTRVKVYGDDLIIHLEDYEAVMQYFPYVGLMFNERKCCTGGSFRESCGLDAFKGVDVTPVKFRTRLSLQHDNCAIVSWIEYSNEFDKRGYSTVADRIAQYLEEDQPSLSRRIPTHFHDHKEVGYLAYRRHLLPQRIPDSPRRWNRDVHLVEMYLVVVEGRRVKRRLPGWELLMAYIASGNSRTARPLRNVQNSELVCSALHLPEEVSKMVMFPVRRQVTLLRRWCAV